MKKNNVKNFLEYIKENMSSDIELGDYLKVPKDLTTDPVDKRGERGEVVKIDKDNETITLKFEDGTIGYYQKSVFDK